MVLYNYYNLLAWLSNYTSGGYYGGSATVYPSNTYTMESSKTGVAMRLYDHESISSGYMLSNIGLWIGSGNTEVTPDDWKLANDVTSSFSSISRSSNRSVINVDGVSKIQVTCTFNGVNNTSDPITIREIGMSKAYARESNQRIYVDMGEAYRTLYIREVLDAPVTVPSGSTFTCTLTWVIG